MGNCLIKALEEKIIHPSWKIYYVKPDKKDGLPHFCWWNPQIGSYQHYTFKGKRGKWWNFIWFKGYVDGFPYEKIKVKFIRIL